MTTKIRPSHFEHFNNYVNALLKENYEFSDEEITGYAKEEWSEFCEHFKDN